MQKLGVKYLALVMIYSDFSKWFLKGLGSSSWTLEL